MTTTITPLETAEALGIDLYELRLVLRRMSAEGLASLSTRFGDTKPLPLSADELRDELERVLRLADATSACDEAYYRSIDEPGSEGV